MKFPASKIKLPFESDPTISHFISSPTSYNPMKFEVTNNSFVLCGSLPLIILHGKFCSLSLKGITSILELT